MKTTADKITEIVGSWRFLITQSVVLLLYIMWNVLPWFPHFDPYPFILLNLALSFQAAYTAPIILMSHGAIADRDRKMAIDDHENTLKILMHIEKLEKTVIKEVDEAVEEIREEIEDEQHESDR